MIRKFTVLSILILAGAAVEGQQMTTPVAPWPPRFDLAGGYQYIRANAPPAECGCFNMNGGFGSATFNLSQWLGLTGKFTMGHASNISSLGQDLTLMTYTGGPTVTWRHYRFNIYGDFLLGGARGSGSYFPTSSGFSSEATSFAWSTGGGVDFRLTDRFSLRAVDAQYLHTSFDNGTSNAQNHLAIGVGIVFHLGQYNSVAPRTSAPEKSPAAPAPEVEFHCSAINPAVNPGDAVKINGQSFTIPDMQPIAYSWSTTGGTVQGNGSMVTVDTVGLAPGKYTVQGRATLQSDPSIGASCRADFEVNQPAITPDSSDAVPPAPLETAGPRLDDFKAHVADTFFDYDQSSIRTDAQVAVQHDAAYLIAHPDMNITIAGYADERGSAEYNIALGLERAKNTRDALAAAGVAMSRMQVMSYGKEKSFCSEEAESCYQLNRRGQLLLNAR